MKSGGNGGAPLEGLTVVALEQAVAAPFTSRQLGDLGARVIKVERPHGGDFARYYDTSVDGESSYFMWLNHGKESVRLDLKDADDNALLTRMIAAADVFIQNLAPGAAARLGLEPERLRERNFGLVTCSISGYGPTGPHAEHKAYDLLVQCEAGMLSVTGTPEEEVKVGVSIADIATGMYAYSGILTALLQRQMSGTGSHVEVSMLDALAEWMTQPYLYATFSGQAVRRTGARHASIAPYGPFRVGDGNKVFLAVQNDREWRRLCHEVLCDDALASDERFATNTARVSNIDVLTDVLENEFADHTRESLTVALDRTDIAHAQLRSVAELDHHPQLAARDRWREVLTPGDAGVRVPLPPGRDVDTGTQRVPTLGQHDEPIRTEFAQRSAL